MDICVVGLPKSGKTSILKVIFQRMGPQYTMMLDPTLKVETITKNFGSYVQINIHDFPGSFDFKDANPPEITILENCGVMIYIIDVQAEPYSDAITYLISCMKFLLKINPKIICKVFLHKTDAEAFIGEDRKTDTLKQIKDSIQSELEPAGLKNVQLDYHLTTVYDHTLIESFSKVVQKIIPNVSYIVGLLDSLITNCKMEKAFLFEMISKTYLASDSTPVEAQSYAICSDMIDVVIDVTYLYGIKNSKESLSFDEKTESVIKLANSTILYYKQIEKYLALICIIKDSNFDRPFLTDYNIDVFKQGLTEVFKASKKKP
mmetsp:Transcript_25171/g.29262  ORF Transcript_25171/g.29262 Transcript_25171/m.29262 type:complete len:318 (-) Transcript_25171:115-1068(-)